MSFDKLSEAYDRIAMKYRFLLDQLDIISTKLSVTSVNIEELRQIVSNAITEVTCNF